MHWEQALRSLYAMKCRDLFGFQFLITCVVHVLL